MSKDEKTENVRDPEKLDGAERVTSVTEGHLVPKEKQLPWILWNPR